MKIKPRFLPVAVLLLLVLALAWWRLGQGSIAVALRSDLLPVVEASGQELLDPQAAFWQQVRPVAVTLSGMEIKGEWPLQLVPLLEVQAARDAANLYFRLSWADTTLDADVADLDRFADAVAVQLPVDPDSQPYVCMGQGDDPVSMLYWRADRQQGEGLLAGRFGSVTSLPAFPVSAQGAHQDGRWSVVLARPLKGQDPLPALAGKFSVAFAVWDGSDQQRGGRKATSNWLTLDLAGTAPQVANH